MAREHRFARNGWAWQRMISIFNGIIRGEIGSCLINWRLNIAEAQSSVGNQALEPVPVRLNRVVSDDISTEESIRVREVKILSEFYTIKSKPKPHCLRSQSRALKMRSTSSQEMSTEPPLNLIIPNEVYLLTGNVHES